MPALGCMLCNAILQRVKLLHCTHTQTLVLLPRGRRGMSGCIAAEHAMLLGSGLGSG
jgi:hypothetical protein